MGWRGNQTKKSVKEVLNEISVLKTVEDCPSVEHSYVLYEPNEKDQLRQELTKKFDYKHGQKCNGEKFQGDKNLI